MRGIRLVAMLALLIPWALLSASRTQAADSAVTASGSVDRPASARVVKYCKGEQVTIWGGKGPNQLVGTSGRDVIHGGPGSDSVSGASGNDLLCGGPGADLLDGGAGADRLYGNKDVDACFGEDDEHVNHFGCEAHLPSLPQNEAAAAAQRLDAPPTQATAAPTGARQAVRTFRISTPPGCTSGSISNFPTVISGAYTTPSYVVIRPVVSYWSPDNTGWMSWQFGNWQQFTLPSGSGTAYLANVTGYSAMPRFRASIWALQAMWWNGTTWVDMSTIGIYTYNQGSQPVPMSYCTT